MIPVDYHLHTTFSKDGKSTLAEVCDAALARGLKEICFTEHMDFDRDDPAYGYLDWKAYAAGIAAAQGRYAGRLTVRKGVEFDFRRAYETVPGEFLAAIDFDFAIGSVHSVAGYHLYDLYKGVPADFNLAKVQAEYFDEVEALVDSGWASAIGHFDYLYKQLPALVAASRDKAYWRRVEGILERCVAGGVAIEVNTHHVLDRGLAMAADLEILRRYRALGGRLVTVGSDAHRAPEVAGHFAAAEQALREAGFDAITGFKQGAPYSITL
jgi:histidinol-phosphatase (PHP family)